MYKPYRHATVADHSLGRPDVIEADGSPTWVTRGANFVIAITRAVEGTTLEVSGVPDEYFVMLPEAPASVLVGGTITEFATNHLLIIPPGDSTLVAQTAGPVVRCFSARNVKLLAQASNFYAYAEPREELLPMQDWPVPVGGFKLRAYDLAAGLAEGDKTRVYRSSNMMINILRERTEARDPRTMSPHYHEDFEQGSITLSGVHVHYLRTPWVPDLSVWRPDEAAEVGASSVTVIPPPLIHTTRNLGDGPALLVDLFCPPREDFSRIPGRVRNDAEYPMPK
jgi:mannose-6-phosphate isomerase-like protein (cupin superfamily)